MSLCRYASLYTIVLFLTVSACSAQKSQSSAEKRVFPGDQWLRVDPAISGVSSGILTRIDSLMKSAKANGVLIKDGYMVGEWNYSGPADKMIETQSISKTMTSMLLGIALREGKIGNIHDKVKNFYPGFSVGPYTDQISFWNLVTATSGIASIRYKENYANPGNMKPGLDSRYHNDHTAELAEALTFIYGESLLSVLKSRVLNKLQASVKWGLDSQITGSEGQEIPVVAGYAFAEIAAADLARIGWLYLNGGKWKGEQILNTSFVKESLTPINVPVMDANPSRVPVELKNMRYGLAWRCRITKEGNQLWYMSGNGGQFCVVIPKTGIVFTKLNNHKERPQIGIDQFENLITDLAQ